MTHAYKCHGLKAYPPTDLNNKRFIEFLYHYHEKPSRCIVKNKAMLISLCKNERQVYNITAQEVMTHKGFNQIW